jgi:protocatechuate 3,4-dioxygenase beta subunit
MTRKTRLDRRSVLALGAGGAASLGLTACARAQETPAPSAQRLVLTAQATEGPFYFDPRLERADITEGLAGVPLDVRFAVVDETGAPLQNARVDIWHCNAAGIYSGYAGQGDDRQTSALGKTFLRGHHPTDAQGLVTFRTVYPGWYRGRTTHIHFKVRNGETSVLTSQFFLPDALSEFLYENLADYKRSAVRDTLNSTDGIALQAGATVIGHVREEKDRYVAFLNIAVDRNAEPRSDRRPDGPPPDRAGLPPRGPEGGPMRATLIGDTRIEAIVPGEKG